MGCLRITYRTDLKLIRGHVGKLPCEEKACRAEPKSDAVTILYYYGARYYDPSISLWLSVDPLAEITMTPYQYTYQNPVRFIDPTGMKGDDWTKGKDGNMVYDKRIKDQASAEAIVAGSKYYGYGQEKNADGGTTTYGVGGKKVVMDNNNRFVSSTTNDSTPAKATVHIENYVAVSTDGEWLANKVSESRVEKYKDKTGGWVGARESEVLALSEDGYQVFSGVCGLCSFMKEYPGARNISDDALGYELLVTLGSAIQMSGSGLEFLSAGTLVPTAGASTAGIWVGRGLQGTGFGVKSYGNHKLGNNLQILKDALKVATMKSGGGVYKKMSKK